MNYYIKNLKWLLISFTKSFDELTLLLPKDSLVPFELIEQYEMIVDPELNNLKESFTPCELSRFRPLHNYVMGLIMSEKYIDKWYDNDFLKSKEWLTLKNLSLKFLEVKHWDKNERLLPLYNKIIYVDSQDDSHY